MKRLRNTMPLPTTDYEKGYFDAMRICHRIFDDFINERIEEGIFYCDLDHIRAYKRYFTEKARHKGQWSPKRGSNQHKRRNVNHTTKAEYPDINEAQPRHY